MGRFSGTSCQGFSCPSLNLISVVPSLMTTHFLPQESTGTVNMILRHLLFTARSCQTACSQEGVVHCRGRGIQCTSQLRKPPSGVGAPWRCREGGEVSELQSAPEGRGQHCRGISCVSHFVWARWFLSPLILGNLSKHCLSFSRVLGDCIKLIAER